MYVPTSAIHLNMTGVSDTKKRKQKATTNKTHAIEHQT